MKESNKDSRKERKKDEKKERKEIFLHRMQKLKLSPK